MRQSDPLHPIIRKASEAEQPASSEVKVRIDTRTGRASLGWGNPFATYEYYIVASSPNRVAVGAATEITVSDFASSRGIGLNVAYEARCSPGAEVRVAEALHGSAAPAAVFHGILRKWVAEFVGPRPADFIRHFTDSQKGLAEYLVKQALRQTGLALLVRLSLGDEETINRTAAVALPQVAVRLKGCNVEQQMALKAELPVDEQHHMSAHLNPLTDEQLGRLLSNMVRAYFSASVTYDEFSADMNSGAFKAQVTSHLNGALQPYGRRLSFLSLVGKVERPPAVCEERVDVRFDVQGLPTPVIIKNTVQMVCRDAAAYVNAGSPELRPWLEQNLNAIFGNRYTDLLLNFGALEREIKIKFGFRVSAIGYDVQLHTITVPYLEPYTWLKEFTIEAGREPDSEVKGITFDTRVSNFSVKLDFAVTTKINELRDISGYLNPYENVPALMKQTIVDEIQRLLHAVEPERFYVRFNETEVKGEETVSAILERNVRNAFKQKFKADISSVIFKIVDDPKIMGPWDALRRKIGEFEVKLSRPDEIGEVIIRGDFQADAIHTKGWSKFQVMNLDVAEIRRQIEKHLQSELGQRIPWELGSAEPEAVRGVRGRIEMLVREYVQKKYGLIMDVTNLRFEIAGTPTYLRQQLEETYTDAQRRHGELMREITGRIYDLRREVTQLMLAGFPEKDIAEKEKIVIQLERYRDSLTTPSWQGDRQLPESERYDPRSLPSQNGSEGQPPDPARGGPTE